MSAPVPGLVNTRAPQWRRDLRILSLAGLAVGLFACGSDDPAPVPAPAPAPAATVPTTPGQFNAVVSFGDSLSDAGTYAPATSVTADGQPPYIGGRFTNNSSTAKVWVEVLAESLGIAATPAVVGFATQSVACPVTNINPGLASSCTLYGQGGARVTSTEGIGKAGGALTEPVKAQIERHLARFNQFTANDLVMVYGGNNDVFVAFGTFAATAEALARAVASGAKTAEQAQAEQGQALTTAQQAMTTAATELSDSVRDDILGRGARYVAVMNLPDSSLTPFGDALPESARGVLSGLVDTFNTAFEAKLADLPVLLIDAHDLAMQVRADPASFGFTNATEPACDEQIISAITQGNVTDGSSLFCNSEPGGTYYSLRAGASETTWQFADDVHPTTGAHRQFEGQVRTALTAAGWL